MPTHAGSIPTDCSAVRYRRRTALGTAETNRRADSTASGLAESAAPLIRNASDLPS